MTYQPSGGRHEIVQHMYLRFREGAVYGVGFEEDRKACKVSRPFAVVYVFTVVKMLELVLEL